MDDGIYFLYESRMWAKQSVLRGAVGLLLLKSRFYGSLGRAPFKLGLDGLSGRGLLALNWDWMVFWGLACQQLSCLKWVWMACQGQHMLARGSCTCLPGAASSTWLTALTPSCFWSGLGWPCSGMHPSSQQYAMAGFWSEVGLRGGGAKISEW